MIYDHIDNLGCYLGLGDISLGLKYLATADNDQPDTAVISSTVHVNRCKAQLKDEEQCVYEAHKKFADIHFVLSGSEKILLAPPESLAESTAYDEQKDIGFYTGKCSAEVVLQKGMFLVCYPQDAHMVLVKTGVDECIDKLVVKVRV